MEELGIRLQRRKKMDSCEIDLGFLFTLKSNFSTYVPFIINENNRKILIFLFFILLFNVDVACLSDILLFIC